VLQVVDRFCLNQPVSRLTLDLVAEIARGTANSAANVVRMLGPSPAAENAELAFAATAFAADAARVGASARSASLALKGLRIGEAAGRIPETEWQQDWHAVQSGTTATAALWLGPAPEWYTVGLSRYHAIKNQFPRWLVWE
jgi:hypothetical protein